MNIIKFIYYYIVQTIETLGVPIQATICGLFVIQILMIRAIIREIQYRLYKRKQTRSKEQQNSNTKSKLLELQSKTCNVPRLPKNPKLIIRIDITGRKNIDSRDVLENYIIDEGFDWATEYLDRLNQWEIQCQSIIDSISDEYDKDRCRLLYNDMQSDQQIIKFICYRNHTKYRYVNGVRQSYIHTDIERTFYMAIDEILDICDELSSINFETTTRKYNQANQRKLMTQELRNKIKERDNYTCQICGKYMPDEVGLHIDHIIPISKGGKTVEQNLQVLCDKCNLRKSNRV